MEFIRVFFHRFELNFDGKYFNKIFRISSEATSICKLMSNLVDSQIYSLAIFTRTKAYWPKKQY